MRSGSAELFEHPQHGGEGDVWSRRQGGGATGHCSSSRFSATWRCHMLCHIVTVVSFRSLTRPACRASQFDLFVLYPWYVPGWSGWNKAGTHVTNVGLGRSVSTADPGGVQLWRRMRLPAIHRRRRCRRTDIPLNSNAGSAAAPAPFRRLDGRPRQRRRTVNRTVRWGQPGVPPGPQRACDGQGSNSMSPSHDRDTTNASP